MQAERVEGHENALVHHHGARTVFLADIRVGSIAINRVPAGQVPWIRVDRRINSYTGADSQNEDARYKSLIWFTTSAALNSSHFSRHRSIYIKGHLIFQEFHTEKGLQAVAHFPI